MHSDNFDLSNVSRKNDFQTICKCALKLAACEHFTPHVVTKLFKKEIEQIKEQYPQLKVEVLGDAPSNRIATSCAIYKK